MTEEIQLSSARALIQTNAKRFEAALHSEPGSGRIRPVEWKPWYAAAIADFERQPKLIEAAVQAPDTVLDALTVAANCGLLPGNAHGQFYLIPRWSGRKRRTECSYVIGYKGLCDMAYRHPRVHKCEGFVVYEGEEFEWMPGDGKLHHRWSPAINRSDDQIIAAYSRVVLTVPGGTTVDEEPLVWVMTRDELLKVRDSSDGYKAYKNKKIKSTPWVEWFSAMCRKTVMRRHLNGGSVPKSADLLMAISSELREEVRLQEDVPERKATANAQSAVREKLGLPPSDMLAEEAVEWIKAAPASQVAQLDLEQWSGSDREIVSQAVADKDAGEEN